MKNKKNINVHYFEPAVVFNYKGVTYCTSRLPGIIYKKRRPHIYIFPDKELPKHMSQIGLAIEVARSKNIYLNKKMGTSQTIIELERKCFNMFVNCVEPPMLITEYFEKTDKYNNIKLIPLTELKKLALKAQKDIVSSNFSKTKRFLRSEYIKQYVIRIANGRCQMCKKKIGNDCFNNIPSLECHHKIPLSKGGSDSIENCIALCPNCHTFVHMNKNKE